MTKKELQKSRDYLLQDRQHMLHCLGIIRTILIPNCKHDGVAPEAVVAAVLRAEEIGNIKPFTELQIREWQQSIGQEIIKNIAEAIHE